MTVDIFDFTREWYGRIQSQKFTLRPINQASSMPWSGAGNAISGPHTQFWAVEVSMMPLYDPVLQDVDAFLTRLRGRARVVRFAYSTRFAPWYDRNLIATRSNFSDGTGFTDGTGFANGYLPPEVYLVNAAVKGARYVTLGGLPASLANCLRGGDLLQIKPNGIPGTVPHLYKTMYGGDTNSSGQIGIEIEPGLRQSVAAGDVVSLRYASTLFRMTDDNQGDVDVTGNGLGTLGFSLIEALDLVP